MIPLIAKLNCLPIKGVFRPHQTKAEKFNTKKGIPVYRNVTPAYTDDLISVVYFDLSNDDPKAIIDQVLGIYDKFSKVSGLMNNDANIIQGTEFHHDEHRMI